MTEVHAMHAVGLFSGKQDNNLKNSLLTTRVYIIDPGQTLPDRMALPFLPQNKTLLVAYFL